MLTWKLWRALLDPPFRNPVYKRAIRQTPLQMPPYFRGVLVMVAYLTLCCCASLAWPFASGLLPALIILVILLFNVTYGAVWAVTFSGVIARERENNTYDLVCVTPSGALAVSWALCMAQLHRTSLFQVVYFGVRLVAITAIIAQAVVLLIPLLTLLQDALSATSLNLLQVLVFGLALSGIFVIDHMGALILANLVGMVTPTFVRAGAESRWRAVLTFVTLQLVGYITLGVMALLIFPALFLLLRIDGWPAHIGLGILAVAVFALIREGIIVGYWRHLSQQLNVEEINIEAKAL